jgi:hypothetical protein
MNTWSVRDLDLKVEQASLLRSIRLTKLKTEGPKTATRGRLNGSRKISREIFGCCPKITTKHANQTPWCPRPNTWMDIRNTAGHHKANAKGKTRNRAQTRKIASKRTPFNCKKFKQSWTINHYLRSNDCFTVAWKWHLKNFGFHLRACPSTYLLEAKADWSFWTRVMGTRRHGLLQSDSLTWDHRERSQS